LDWAAEAHHPSGTDDGRISTVRHARPNALTVAESPRVRSIGTHVIGEATMSGTSDKIKGMANEVVGNIKQGVGKVTGNESLQVKGKIQEKKGEAQQVVGDVKDAVDKR
jgi:uncharacterized protein YjbJ (UPF0337 family)